MYCLSVCVCVWLCLCVSCFIFNCFYTKFGTLLSPFTLCRSQKRNPKFRSTITKRGTTTKWTHTRIIWHPMLVSRSSQRLLVATLCCNWMERFHSQKIIPCTDTITRPCITRTIMRPAWTRQRSFRRWQHLTKIWPWVCICISMEAAALALAWSTWCQWRSVGYPFPPKVPALSFIYFRLQFHFGYNETILFSWWHIETVAGLIGSMIAIFLLALLYEGLKYYREYLFWKTYNLLEYRPVTGPQRNPEAPRLPPPAAAAPSPVQWVSYGYAGSSFFSSVQFRFVLFCVHLPWSVPVPVRRRLL